MKSLGVQRPPQPPPLLQAVPPPSTPTQAFTEDIPPLEKKQKLEEEDDKVSWTSFGSDLETECNDVVSENCDDYSSEDEYCPNYPQQKKRDQALWDKYYQQIEESDFLYILMASSIPNEKDIPQENLSVPGRHSCSKPEDSDIGEDPCFQTVVAGLFLPLKP